MSSREVPKKKTAEELEEEKKKAEEEAKKPPKLSWWDRLGGNARKLMFMRAAMGGNEGLNAQIRDLIGCSNQNRLQSMLMVA